MSGGSSRRHSALVATGILVSRITGLIRERALGHFLGVGAATDAFTLAFRIPGLLQRLLGDGALSATFIPVYSRLLAEGRTETAGKVVGAVAGLLTCVAGAFALLGLVLARPLTYLIAPGLAFRPETFELAVDLVAVMFPAVSFSILSAWCLGILNSHRRFFLSYVAPALINVVQIAVLVVLGTTLFTSARVGSVELAQGRLVFWLAVGTVVGGALQVLVQLPTVLRVTGGVRPSLNARLPDVRTVLVNLVPVAGARGVTHLATYLHIFLASFLAVGALSTLRYAQVLYLLPVSLFGVSVAAAELPRLSGATATAGSEGSTRLKEGLARIAVFVLPTTAGYLVVGDHVVSALFQTGQFDRTASVAVWLVLAGYTLGLPASTSSRLLQSSLYAMGDTRTPSRIAALRVLFSAVFGVALMFQFEQVTVSGAGVQLSGALPAFHLPSGQTTQGALRLGAVGLALGGAVGAWAEFILLRRAITNNGCDARLGGGHLGRIVLASLAAGASGLAVRPVVDELHPILAGGASIAALVSAYSLAAHYLRIEEFDAIRRGAIRRLGSGLRAFRRP